MNSRLALLQAYPFERLSRLVAAQTPNAALKPIVLTIGEPRHEPPAFVLETLRASLARLDSYPATAGLPELRAACARWLERRFGLGDRAVDERTMVLPVNGTREALFAFAQAVIDPEQREPRPLVVMPNPCYQIYEGAALLAGAEPVLMPTTTATRFLADLDAVPESVWRRCALLYLCSPGNPTGAVMNHAALRRAVELAQRHEFVIASDECYSELYLDEDAPPPSLLQAARSLGLADFRRCVVFHSLSKRSSLPGLRSGFVAGDPAILAKFLLYRTYHGSAMSVPTQLASIAAWNDEAHVADNRRLYREKFARVLPILEPWLGIYRPDGGFYVWADVRGDDVRFAVDLHRAQNLLVLPGSFLGRAGPDGNPGAGRIRISLVASAEDCVDAAQRIRDFVKG